MAERKSPITSFLEDDPDLMDEIGTFVIGLAELVDLLQDSEVSAQWETLGEMSLALARRAERFGYPELAQIARGVARSAADGKPEDARAGLVELTDMAQRVRLGHRGAS